MSYKGDRPHDFVVASLITRSFRLAIMALYAGLAGYEDAVPVLMRPVYEMGLRLLQINSEPIPASLGYLLGGVREEIRIAKSWLQHVRDDDQPAGNLERNIEELLDYAQDLEKEMEIHGLSPERVEKQYGKLGVKRVAEDFGIDESYYDVSYGFMSGYVHERGFAFDDYHFETLTQRVFAVGPYSRNPEAIVDVFLDLLRNLAVAASIVGEPDLESRAIEAYEKANQASGPH